MTAVVQGDVPVLGTQFSCQSCHGRGGMGAGEGGLLVPAVAGPILFEPEPQRGRPAYTEASLARALRGGGDPAGRALSPIMPRYPLEDEETAALAAYLRTLSSQPSAGVDAERIRFATVFGDAGLWVIPAERLKGRKGDGKAHRVPLSKQAVELLKGLHGLNAELVFPGSTEDKPLSNMAMLTLLRRMDAAKRTTVHGLCRASFSTWPNETGAARSEVIEACLAHRESDRVRAAYNRAQFAAERRVLLAAWADYWASKEPASNVIKLARRRAAA